MGITPGMRSAIASVAADVRWSKTVDRKEAMREVWSAGPASTRYWEAKVRENPDFADATDEQVRLAAESMKRAHFKRLAIASAKARSKTGDAA